MTSACYAAVENLSLGKMLPAVVLAAQMWPLGVLLYIAASCACLACLHLQGNVFWYKKCLSYGFSSSEVSHFFQELVLISLSGSYI